MQIIPAIYEEFEKEVYKKLDLLKDVATTVQIDVTDNKFTTGHSFNLEKLNDYIDKEQFVWEMHLMTEDPIKWLPVCEKVGALRVMGQVEKMADPMAFLETAHEHGFEAGLAFDIDTPIKDLPLDVDIVLIMGRKAGKTPEELDERVWEKIKTAKKLQEELGIPFTIAVDGGVEEKHLAGLAEAGVNVVYTTHLIFNGNVAENMERLKGLVE